MNGRTASRALTLMVVLPALVAAGCGTHQLRQAQDAFSEGARIENANHPGAATHDGGMLAGQSAVGNYRLALSLVEDALAKHKQGLRDDRLYGTARMLKVLCLWRLAGLSDAEDYGASFEREREQLEREARTPGLVLGSRDRVLLEALPGLREHDIGLRATTWESANRLFDSAYRTLGDSFKNAGVSDEHPVAIYIRFAQLSTCIAWRVAAYRLSDNDTQAGQRVKEANDRFAALYEDTKKKWTEHRIVVEQLNQLKTLMGI